MNENVQNETTSLPAVPGFIRNYSCYVVLGVFLASRRQKWLIFAAPTGWLLPGLRRLGGRFGILMLSHVRTVMRGTFVLDFALPLAGE